MAQGFRQVPGFDFDPNKRYPPTACAHSNMMIMAEVAIGNSDFHHVDVKQALIQALVRKRGGESHAAREWGVLLWALTMARPNIVDAVRSVARYCENSAQGHGKVVVKILELLRETLGLGKAYDGKGGKTGIFAYFNTGHRTDLDAKRSVPGEVIMLAFAAFFCFSRTPRAVALSTTESEYTAMSKVVKEVICIRQVQAFMKPGVKQYCVNVMYDNEGAIQIAHNSLSSHRTKHIDVRHIFSRQYEQGKDIQINPI